jgi:hypothetical protein
VIYVPSFIKIGSGIQNLTGGCIDTNTHTDTHRQQGDLISRLLSFQNKERGLKMNLREIGWDNMDWIDLA